MKVLKSLITAIAAILFFACNIPSNNSDQPKNEGKNHQNRLASAINTASSKQGMTIDYIYEANTIILNFPQDQPAPTGKATFFSPTKADKDRTFELKTDPSKRMFILVEDFTKGLWRIKVEWQAEDKMYAHEDSFNIQPNDWARPIHK